MNIEVIEFYPNNNPKYKTLLGTVHCYLPDLDVDLRGICVFKNKQYIIVRIPSGRGEDPETKKKISYPLFSFLNPEKTQQMIREIRQKTIEYLDDNKII